MSASRWVHIEVTIRHETDNAFLVEVEGHDGSIWIPKSQVADPDDYEAGDTGTLSITEWLARKKGICA